MVMRSGKVLARKAPSVSSPPDKLITCSQPCEYQRAFFSTGEDVKTGCCVIPLSYVFCLFFLQFVFFVD